MTTFQEAFSNYTGREDQKLEAPQPDPRRVLSTKDIAVPPDASKEYLEGMMALLEKQESDKTANQMNVEVVRPASHVTDAYDRDSEVGDVQRHNGLHA